MTTTTLTTGYVSFASSTYISASSGPGVYSAQTNQTFINAGTLVAAVSGNYSVFFSAGGSVTNSGGIHGAGGIRITGGTSDSAFVDNSNAITPTGSGFGVRLDNGGTITNSGSIGGGGGVRVTGGTAGVAKLTNSGTISPTGGQYGVQLLNGGVVTNSSTGVIFLDVYLNGAGESLNNAGTVHGGKAAYLFGNGAVTNSGSLLGTDTGVWFRGAGNVTNTGSINGGGRYGVIMLLSGGTVTNNGGQITAVQRAIENQGGGGLVVYNSGIVSATTSNSYGIFSTTGAAITNAANGTITGHVGVAVGAGSTILNTGSIGGATYAVKMAAGAANQLNVYGGASFSGTINGGNTLGAANLSTVDFVSGSGSLGGFGGSVVNFDRVIFAPGASWSISGSSAALAPEVITGFHGGDRIDIAGIGTTGVSVSVTGSVVHVLDGGGGTIFTFSDLLGPSGASLVPANIVVSGDGNGGTAIACFAQGTRIQTPAGACAVESLRQGDSVVSHFGGTAPVVWTGHRHIDCRRHPHPSQVWPVHVRADAFGPGTPHCDLVLSPDHAVHVDHVLIPIRTLINGTSIVQTPVDSVTYWHVELPAHDVILAEGLPAESYLDTGNRSAFANGGPALQLHPDLAQETWNAAACAPQITRGPIHAAVVARLEARALTLGAAKAASAA